MMVFLLKRDNRAVAGSGDLVRDADLLRRALGPDGAAGRNLLAKEYYYEWFRENRIVYPRNRGGAWNDDAGNLFHASGRYPAHERILPAFLRRRCRFPGHGENRCRLAREWRRGPRGGTLLQHVGHQWRLGWG